MPYLYTNIGFDPIGDFYTTKKLNGDGSGLTNLSGGVAGAFNTSIGRSTRNLARSLEAQGKKAEAEKAYEQVLAIDSRAPVAANNLAWIYVASNRNLDQALQLAQTAHQTLPEEPAVNDTLGWILVQKDMAARGVPYRCFVRPDTRIPFMAMPDAIEALLAGRAVPVETTKPFGCSTKWREKHAGHVAKETAWTQIPVVTERIGAAGISALRSNPTNKFRLFNVWATWCAPCVKEMPSLDRLQAAMGKDKFVVIPLSLDGPSKPKVKPFYEDKRLANLGIYFDKAKKSMQALDVGILPTSFLIDGQGRQLGRLEGEADWDTPEAIALMRAAVGAT